MTRRKLPAVRRARLQRLRREQSELKNEIANLEREIAADVAAAPPGMILQTVQIYATDPPPAPYVIRAADGGWHFDCGNSVGWSGPFPDPCKCGHCLPRYEEVRQAAAAAFALEAE